MSAGHKRLYTQCLEQHSTLTQFQAELIELGTIMRSDRAPYIDGCEGLKDQALDSLTSVGRGLFSISKWVGGKAIDGFLKGISYAGSQVDKSFNDNQSLIKNILKDVNKVADKEIKLSPAKVSLITAKGDANHILQDMEILIKTLEAFDKHNKDLMSYLDKELITLKKLKGANKSEQIHSVIDEFGNLQYPEMRLANHMGDAYKSDMLPGGRFFIFTNKDKPGYSMSGEASEGEGKDLSMSKTEISEILNKLEKVNAIHVRVKESYDNYLGFIKSWSEMVKGVDGNLSQLDQVSKTVITEAEKLMSGNMAALTFYSAFTPRVVGYTDKYIHGVLGVFA